MTTLATIPPDCAAQAKITAKAGLTIAGLPLVEMVLQAVDVQTGARLLKSEGNVVKKGEIAVELWGKAASLLIAERTLLNFLQRLSGVATLTRQFVE